jgi:hypothetical protein
MGLLPQFAERSTPSTDFFSALKSSRRHVCWEMGAATGESYGVCFPIMWDELRGRRSRYVKPL